MLHSLPVLYAKVNGGYVEFTAPQPRILYSFHKLAGNFTESKFLEAKYLWISYFDVAQKVEKRGCSSLEEHPSEHPLLYERISV